VVQPREIAGGDLPEMPATLVLALGGPIGRKCLDFSAISAAAAASAREYSRTHAESAVEFSSPNIGFCGWQKRGFDSPFL